MSQNPAVQPHFLERIMGANYKTTLTSALAAMASALTIISLIPYDSSYEAISTLFPPKVKSRVTLVAAIAALILKITNGYFQKSKNVTGGRVLQNPQGDVVDKV